MARQDTPEAIARAINELLGIVGVGRTRVSLDFGSIAAEASAALTVTVTGAVLGDYVLAGPETDLDDDLVASFQFVSVADTVEIRMYNGHVAAGAAIDPAATVWSCCVLRASRTSV